LKSQGWDDARIAGYRGSPADNIALQKAISGKSAWDEEQEVQAAQAQRVGTFYSKMSDSDKRALQDMLKSAGYYKGEINGLIDNVVLDALRKFQQDNKLTVDGMAGRNTFDVLRAKTRQVAQPVIDPTAVPGYTQAMQLLNQMNGSASAAPVKTGRPTGGMGLNDVHQGRDVQLVGPKVGLNLTAGLEIPQRKQGGQLNYANYLN
jgi:peptidoglycan hydrolase-like protein with peptidoglycan-binding domain